MNTNGLRGWALAALLVAGLAGTAAAEGDYALHGRVSYDGGATLIRGVAEADWSEATVNTLVLPGDIIWADEGGMLEIELPGGGFLRMADGTKVELVQLDPDTVLRGWEGSYYVQRLSRATGSFRVVTPACAVEVEPNTAVRIDVVDDGATTVTVRWGRALVHAGDADVTVLESGRRAWVDPGFMPSFPVAFDPSEDDAFDGWNRERAEWLATGGQPAPAAVRIEEPVMGLADLDYYGDWLVVDSRPVWRPTVVVDYVPYRYGRWSYTSGFGHVWVDQYPFAYVTSHYGRWDYVDRYGWVWAYDPVWSPAWAATVRCGDYFVWSPIGFGYQPVYTSSWSYFTFGGVRFSHFATSYVPVSGLYLDYGYVRCAEPTLFTDGYIAVNNPHIWNIYDGHRGSYRPRIPYGDGIRYASYAPTRPVRGLGAMLEVAGGARDRAGRLESRSGRSSFTQLAVTAPRAGRTARGETDRSARVRTLRVAPETPSYARATREAPVNAARVQEEARLTRARTEAALPTREGRGGRAETTVRRGPTNETRPAVRPERTGGSAVPEVRTTRTPAPDTRVRVPETRGNAAAPTREPSTVSRPDTATRAPSRTARPETGTVRRESAPIRTETRTIPRESAPDTRNRTVAPERTTTRPRVVSTGSSDRTPSTPHIVRRESTRPNEAPTMVRREVSRTEPRVTSTARTPSETPVRRSVPVTTRPTREPAVSTRTPAPEVRSPSRSVSRPEPSTPSYTPAPTRTPEPRVSTPSRPSYTPPSSSSRSSVSTPRSTPSRPSVSTPSRSSSTPSRPTVSTPSRSSSTPSASTRSSSASSRETVRGGRR